MFSRIETLPKTLLVGKSIRMSLSNNKTRDLWKGFMPRLKEIGERKGKNLYSLQIYDNINDILNFTPQVQFNKYAMVPVPNFNNIPKAMETLVIEESRYAVFIHTGLPELFPKTAAYIYGKWLPESDYEVDHRPHFELLGPAYSPLNENSKEEVWIPIKLKQAKP